MSNGPNEGNADDNINYRVLPPHPLSLVNIIMMNDGDTVKCTDFNSSLQLHEHLKAHLFFTLVMILIS